MWYLVLTYVLSGQSTIQTVQQQDLKSCIQHKKESAEELKNSDLVLKNGMTFTLKCTLIK